MANISNIIEQFILDTMGDDSSIEISRNSLAEYFNCVPSQINYVLSSRFTPEHGYIIDSRRGGGGYIKISRVNLSRSSALMHIINAVGSTIDSMSARIVVENCLQSGLITADTASS